MYYLTHAYYVATLLTLDALFQIGTASDQCARFATDKRLEILLLVTIKKGHVHDGGGQLFHLALVHVWVQLNRI